ncbi:MAG: bifunctional UDP-sugar hydrolase/5'-nucleotidase [Ignavibacteriales bacterium]|nr:bifunctional UDP-sugar hydrolase/5'-nucleotidase [Ignavibacteriales bacterium]
MKTWKIYPLFLLFLISCSKENTVTEPASNKQTKDITIIYTNDEHGWMEATSTRGGAAGMMGLWKQNESYAENKPYLILSGGDMWTGPSISTWFEGKSMTEVMNKMNYSAAAVGNHEFDFGFDKLLERKNQSKFPFLSANMKNKINGGYPDFASPYIIKEVNGVKVGIIGLTSVYITSIVFPKYLENLELISYQEALNTVVPKMKSEGAKLLIIISHMGEAEMRTLAPVAKKMGISFIAGGHTHETILEVVNGVTIIESGSNMMSYSVASIHLDAVVDTVISISANIKDNIGGNSDLDVKSIVDSWKIQTNNELSKVIGYTKSDIGISSASMYNLITDSWLYSFPYADISISNRGGVRQSIPAGDITLASIVGILPFDNEIVELQLTGAQLISALNSIKNEVFVGGISTIGVYTLKDGSSVNLSKTYRVLTTDFYYSITQILQQYDDVPIYYKVNWRQPVIDWIKSLNTTVSNPLDNYLDKSLRQSAQYVFYY